MKELGELWSRLEKWAIYSILFLFVVLQLISIFVPSISAFLDRRGEVILIGFVLLFVFRYLDEKLQLVNEQAIKISGTFLPGLMNVLGDKQEYSRVDLIAHTSQVYVRGVLDSRARIKEMRVLLRDMRTLDRITLPEGEDAKRKIQQEWEDSIQKWHDLKKNGYIQKLSLRYYPFDPMMGQMVMDGRVAYFGLMKPQKEFPGATSKNTLTSYIVTDKTAEGRQIIRDLSIQFEQIWNEFADADVQNVALGD